ncbi:transcriptional regulator with XRE-family HTH domain [Paenibacillus turicensis]|uniref:Transcriptional regulator with XRE-family HTH domain n=1 Tax=Paenibacillus turicensis TaxID=160487 RepID=A0ABS4FSX9_9BACL|nr:transcriptional regulator with XRE-family HTH domain [Paenibacillus turicensis]
MYSFGEKLKNLRMSKGLSQGQLADKLNEEYGTSINKGMISKWENDKEEPRMEAVRNLVLFFGITLDHLIGVTNNDENTNNIDIATDMKALLNTLEDKSQVVKFNGITLNDDVKSTLKISIENLVLLTEQLSKK